MDTALKKIALGYQQHKGKTDKMILVGRERAYHGVWFGGISVGGLPLNKQHFSLLKNVDHIVTTHNLEKNAFSKGMPEWGGDLAEDLNRIIETWSGTNCRFYYRAYGRVNGCFNTTERIFEKN